MPLLPSQVAASCIRRANRFLDLAERKLPVARTKNDLRRMAVVMAVAAVDSYMHAIVLKRASHVRERGTLPKSLRRVSMPFSELSSLAEASLDARRAERDARPWVQVKNALQRKLLTVTFQSYDQVGDALSMAGIDKGWSKVADRLGESCEIIKERLDRLVHRRNQITHEGDMMRASRPQRLRFNAVAHNEIRDDVAWIASVIDAIDQVMEAES